jgi:beta-1,4-N-acetylglucosaminyltransferase
VFVESFCRVETLSATGMLLYYLPLADAFLVQWPQLKVKYPQADYIGRLV